MFGKSPEAEFEIRPNSIGESKYGQVPRSPQTRRGHHTVRIRDKDTRMLKYVYPIYTILKADADL